MSSVDSTTGLPPNWEVRHSKSKNLPYYFNPETRESRWDPPPGADLALINAHMTSRTAASDKVWAAHLLVKHAQSRRPASWRSENITRSKEEARGILKGYEQRIRAGEVTLRGLAETESDCSSARKGGDLGYFGRGDMQKAFEDAAFALEPGQMSGIIETDSGLHLIERIA